MLKAAKLIVLAGLFPAIAAATQTSAPGSSFTVSPETTSLLGPVRADGSIDYIAALNQRSGQDVNPDNNGFVLWLRVMGPKNIPQSVAKQMIVMCGAETLPNSAPSWNSYDKDTPSGQPIVRPWKAEDNPGLAAFLKSNENFLTLATQAAAKPKWWMPTVSINDSMMGVLLPQLNNMRGIALSLSNRALLRAQQGDFKGFLSDVITVKRLSRRASGTFVINDLVAFGMDNLANRTIGAVAGLGIFTSDQCAELAKALDGIEPLPPLRESVDTGERWSMLDCTESIATGNSQRLSADNPHNENWSEVFKAVNRDSVDWNAVLQQMNSDCDQMIQIMKISSITDERIAWQDFGRKMTSNKVNPTPTALLKKSGETNEAYTDRVIDAMHTMVLPSLGRASEAARSTVMQDKMIRAVVAVAQYRADKGNWPDQLEDLIPDYLPDAPVEAFAPSPAPIVRYQKTARGICLRARGNGKPDVVLGAE